MPWRLNLAATRSWLKSKASLADRQSKISNLLLGNTTLYQGFLELVDPERKLFLAVSRGVYNGLFSQRAIQVIAQRYKLPILVVDVESEEIVVWTKSPTTEI